MRACPKVGSNRKTRPIILSIALAAKGITTTTDVDKKLIYIFFKSVNKTEDSLPKSHSKPGVQGGWETCVMP